MICVITPITVYRILAHACAIIAKPSNTSGRRTRKCGNVSCLRLLPPMLCLFLFCFPFIVFFLLLIVISLYCDVDVSFTGVRLRSAKKGIFLMSWDMKVEIEQRVGRNHLFVYWFDCCLSSALLSHPLSPPCPTSCLSSLLFVFFTTGVRRSSMGDRHQSHRTKTHGQGLGVPSGPTA